MKQWFLKNN